MITGSTPYDGNGAGQFLGDAMRRMEGTLFSIPALYNDGVFINNTGNTTEGSRSAVPGPDVWGLAYNHFDNNLVTPTAKENRPASISGTVYMTY